jgi:predicted ATP-binding protein involved in virulence
MIRRVSLRYFKTFEKQDFDLNDHIILAGPNNSGKTTLLQAIVVWALALYPFTGR